MNYSIDNKILDICKYNYDNFLCKNNVVGVGLSYKIIKGIETNEKCIQVYVIKKFPLSALNPSDIIPKLYKGIKTDVLESGPFEAFSLKERVRPTLGGYSIGPNISSLVGSICCLVSGNDNIYILGNNHVLAGENSFSIGTNILQPSIADGGIFPKDVVANLFTFLPLEFTTPTTSPENLVDAAIAKVTTPSIASPAIAYIGRPTGITPPKLNLIVQSASRSSDYALGKITSIGATITIKLPSGKYIKLLNQIISNIHNTFGDSGALLLDVTRKAIGMLNGGTKTLCNYSPILTVLNSLNVSLVTS